MSVTVPADVFAMTPGPATSHRKVTILVAEDSADSREMMEVLLQRKGYEVLLAGDGVNAVTLALSGRPDLVLVDLELPVLDGFTVARELRSHPELNGVSIIIVSGHDISLYQEAALAAGCDDYLMKPIDFARLDQILDRIRLAKLSREMPDKGCSQASNRGASASCG